MLDTVYAIYRYISIFRTTGLLLFMWVNTDKVKACVMVMTWTRVQYFMHSYACIYTVHICIRDAWGSVGQYAHVSNVLVPACVVAKINAIGILKICTT